MAILVRAAGSCGEFVQGALDGKPFLITCPVNRFSYALTSVAQPPREYPAELQEKSQAAIQKTLAYLGLSSLAHPMYVRSTIPQGKGMASSSADISAVALATALQAGRMLSGEDLERIALAIEPSDATFHAGIVQFDYLSGTMSKRLGPCPPLQILIFDEGGAVDTVSFNNREDLQRLVGEKEALIEESVSLFLQGIAEQDVMRIGQASTLSAFANQRILPKPSLYTLHEIGVYYESIGLVVAHSGTVMGLLFPVGSGVDMRAVVQTVTAQLPSLRFLDVVETYNGGITYTTYAASSEGHGRRKPIVWRGL